MIEGELRALGLTVIRDEVGEQCGSDGFNIYAFLPGRGEPILFSAHFDTVSPGIGVEAVVVDGVIRSKGDTILGADDKAGIAAVLESIQMILEEGSDHRPVEVFFTVCEETGLWGSKYADYTRMQSKQAIVLDNSILGDVINQAPAMLEISVEITGRSAHAALSPQTGISAVKAAAAAIVNIPCGNVDDQTVMNVANLLAPGKSNIVAEKARFDVDLRSFDEAVLQKHAAGVEQAVKEACEALGASYTIDSKRKSDIVYVPPENPVIGLLEKTFSDLGMEIRLKRTYGGSDATWLFKNGLDAVNIGIGMMDVHSTNEHIAVADLETITRVVYTMMRG